MQRDKNETHWIQIISESRSYAAGIAAYCRDNDISYKNYYRWFSKLKKDHPEWSTQEEGSGTEEVPVKSKSSRRKITAERKADILREIENAPHGQVGAILRREGIYSSTVTKWKAERAHRALSPKKRGPKVDAKEKEIQFLKEQVARLTNKLNKAEKVIDLQKKISDILGMTNSEES